MPSAYGRKRCSLSQVSRRVNSFWRDSRRNSRKMKSRQDARTAFFSVSRAFSIPQVLADDLRSWSISALGGTMSAIAIYRQQPFGGSGPANSEEGALSRVMRLHCECLGVVQF